MSTAWPHQVRAIEAVWSVWESGSDDRLLLALPTGTGKTRTALDIVRGAVVRSARVLIVVPTIVLVDQPLAAMAEHAPDLHAIAGAVQAERSDDDAALVVASAATLTVPGRLDRILAHGPIHLLVVDEAHHALSDTWWAIIRRIEAHTQAAGETVRVLGLTATPYRADGRPLGMHWRVASSYWIVHAIQDGYLVPPRIVVDRLPGMRDIRRGRADYVQSDLIAALDAAGAARWTAEAMGRHARGRRAVVYTITVAQAMETADALNADGWRAAWVSGETPAAEVDTILAALARGALDAVCNASKLVEGWDCPGVDCVVLARPTESMAWYIQMLGRGLRIAPGKVDCLVVDIAGTSEILDWRTPGAPDAEGRPDWDMTREARVKRAAAEEEAGSVYDGLLRRRREVAINAWVPLERLDRGAWCLAAGTASTVYAVQTAPDADTWWAWVQHSAGDGRPMRWERLVDGDLDEPSALIIGGAHALRVDRSLARRESSRRAKPATGAQNGRLGRWKMPKEKTMGTAADALASRLGRWALIKARLACDVGEVST